MVVRLLKYPVVNDWCEVYRRALVTQGKETDNIPTTEWSKRILRAKHSPVRFLQFSFYIECHYWVSVHLCRHVHAQPYVKSQRNDRQSEYDRNAARQDESVCMIWDMNAEELVTICNKRLCMKTAEETRKVVEMMRDAVLYKCPEFREVLVPICDRENVCNEMHPCGRKQTEFGLQTLINTINDKVFKQGEEKAYTDVIERFSIGMSEEEIVEWINEQKEILKVDENEI